MGIDENPTSPLPPYLLRSAQTRLRPTNMASHGFRAGPGPPAVHVRAVARNTRWRRLLSRPTETEGFCLPHLPHFLGRIALLLCSALIAAACATVPQDRNPTVSTSSLAGAGAAAGAVAPARRAYHSMVEALNTRDEARFVGLHLPSYCHYDTLYTPSHGLPQAYERRLESKGNGPWNDPQVAVLSAAPTRVVFLQTELFMAPKQAPKRFFKLIEMRKAGQSWRLAATGTRQRHACASKLLDGIPNERIDKLKGELLAAEGTPFPLLEDSVTEAKEGLGSVLSRAKGLVLADRTLLASSVSNLLTLTANVDGKPGTEWVVAHNPEPYFDLDAAYKEQESTLWVFKRDPSGTWMLAARRTYEMDPLSEGTYDGPAGIQMGMTRDGLLRVDHIMMRGAMDPRYFLKTTHLLRLEGSGGAREVFSCEVLAEYVRGANRNVVAERTIELAWRGNHIVATDSATRFQTTFRPGNIGMYESLGGPVCAERLEPE